MSAPVQDCVIVGEDGLEDAACDVSRVYICKHDLNLPGNTCITRRGKLLLEDREDY